MVLSSALMCARDGVPPSPAEAEQTHVRRGPRVPPPLRPARSRPHRMPVVQRVVRATPSCAPAVVAAIAMRRGWHWRRKRQSVARGRSAPAGVSERSRPGGWSRSESSAERFAPCARMRMTIGATSAEFWKMLVRGCWQPAVLWHRREQPQAYRAPRSQPSPADEEPGHDKLLAGRGCYNTVYTCAFSIEEPLLNHMLTTALRRRLSVR